MLLCLVNHGSVLGPDFPNTENSASKSRKLALWSLRELRFTIHL